MDKALKKLHKYYGYDNFYPFQEKVIEEVLKKKDIFVLAKTSAGKSVCFQIPALIYRGLTIIISPLRSLIDDQVSNLRKKNIPCCTFYGEMSKDEKENIINNFDNKSKLDFHILYTTPETLESNIDFFQLLLRLYSKNLISRFVIDEAHTLSLWGHNFRRSYLKLTKLKVIFPKVPITALTATATYYIQKDIINILKIEEATIIRDDLFRNNLNITVKLSHFNKDKEISDYIISNFNDKTGIIFCITQQKCEEYTNFLQKYKINAKFYHAGMSKKERSQTQHEWINNEIKVIVATIAFGMGIDKPDVRFIIHYNTPESIEGYFQEIGRAGRDNKISECILYYDPIDINIHKGMIASNKDADIYYKNYQISKLIDLQDYINNIHDCRHQILCLNFGEKLKYKCKNKCDNCTRCKKKIYNFNFSMISEKILYYIEKYKTRICSDKLIEKILKIKKFNLKFGNLNKSVIKRILFYLQINNFIDIKVINIDNIWSMRYILDKKEFDSKNEYYLPFYTGASNNISNIFNYNLENSDPNIEYINIITPILNINL